jgi:hypothetical protein
MAGLMVTHPQKTNFDEVELTQWKNTNGISCQWLSQQKQYQLLHV